MPIPSMANETKPAKTKGTSKFDCAVNIICPIPELAATVSDITEPTNANVIATFKDAKKYGKDRGIPTLTII